MSSYASAQNGYPKRIVLSSGDTVNCFTDKQVIQINQMYISGEESKELLDTCMNQKAKRDTVIRDLVLVKESLLKERTKSKEVNNLAASVIKEVKVLNKKEKRKLKLTKIKAKLTKVVLTTVTTVSTVSAVTLGIMLSNKK